MTDADQDLINEVGSYVCARLTAASSSIPATFRTVELPYPELVLTVTHPGIEPKRYTRYSYGLLGLRMASLQQVGGAIIERARGDIERYKRLNP